MTKKCIYVLQARWVLIGTVVDSPDQDQVHLTGASVIRIWGTSKGLGEIALNGPTSKTVLDPCGSVSIPKAAVLFSIACKA